MVLAGGDRGGPALELARAGAVDVMRLDEAGEADGLQGDPWSTLSSVCSCSSLHAEMRKCLRHRRPEGAAEVDLALCRLALGDPLDA